MSDDKPDGSPKKKSDSSAPPPASGPGNSEPPQNTGVRIPPSPSLRKPLPRHVEERCEARVSATSLGNHFIFGRPWANDLRERRRRAREQSET